jgi:NAD(P)-dependent dehydrogenase (short-subunit alcohol dehydrogenase family)
MRFKDQVAIVTGGNRGLGRALCFGLAREGARVVVAARSPEHNQDTIREIIGQGGEAIPTSVDVSDPSSVDKMVTQVLSEWGQIDILVNNAGIQGKIAWVVDFEPAEWDRILAINLRGPFLCSRAVLPGMIARRKGKILNVAAGVMDERVDWGCAAYYASKAGLVNLTRQLAAEVKRYRIFVNAIDPGGMDTSMSDEIMEVERISEEFARTQTNRNPALRLRKPEAIVPMALFLISGESDMMTGRLLQASSQDDVQYLQL